MPTLSLRDRATYVKDKWAAETLRELGHTEVRRRFIHLYLNGLYWGIYEIMDSPDEDFFAAHGVAPSDPDDWDVIKDGFTDSGDITAWEQLHTLAAQVRDLEKAAPGSASAFTDPTSPLGQVAALLDIDNFIDYLIVNVYMRNLDWPRHNYIAARNRAAGEPFKFYSWDAEWSFGGWSPGSSNTWGRAASLQPDPGRLYYDLRASAIFNALLQARMAEIFAQNLQLHHVEAAGRFASLAERLAPVILSESARWGHLYPDRLSTGAPYYSYGDWQQAVRWVTGAYFQVVADLTANEPNFSNSEGGDDERNPAEGTSDALDGFQSGGGTPPPTETTTISSEISAAAQDAASEDKAPRSPKLKVVVYPPATLPNEGPPIRIPSDPGAPYLGILVPNNDNNDGDTHRAGQPMPRDNDETPNGSATVSATDDDLVRVDLNIARLLSSFSPTERKTFTVHLAITGKVRVFSAPPIPTPIESEGLGDGLTLSLSLDNPNEDSPLFLLAKPKTVTFYVEGLKEFTNGKIELSYDEGSEESAESGESRSTTVGLHPVVIRSVTSNQIPNNTANRLPSAYFGDHPNNPMLMGTRVGANAMLQIGVELPASLASHIRVGVRKVSALGNEGIIKSVMPRPLPDKTAFTFKAEKGSKTYEIVAGYDTNEDSVLDKSEATIEFIMTPLTDAEGDPYSGDFAHLLDKFVVVTQNEFDDARKIADDYGELGLGAFPLAMPTASGLINAFTQGQTTIAGASPTTFGILLDANEIPSDEGLSHPLGGKWNNKNQTVTHRITLPDGSDLSDDVENSAGLIAMFKRVIEKNIATIFLLAGDQWGEISIQFEDRDIDFKASDEKQQVHVALGKCRASGTLNVYCRRLANGSIEVKKAKCLASFFDMYDWSYGAPIIGILSITIDPKEPARAQAGYATLTKAPYPDSGRVFYTVVNTDSPWKDISETYFP